MDYEDVILSGLRAQREKWKKLMEFRDLTEDETMEYSKILKQIDKIYVKYS